jgi:hypothetical protein
LTLRAWVDESGSDHVNDPNTYILAAAVLLESHEEPTRSMMLGLRLPGQVKLHWRGESAKRRTRIITGIASTAVEHVAVVRRAGGPEASERARRKCTEHLLFHLSSLHVGQITFESRGPADDRRDVRLVDSLRRKKSLPNPLRVDHVRGRDEPLLWIPDAACGAISEYRCGAPANFEILRRRATLHDG